jgi:hypothetical protein
MHRIVKIFQHRQLSIIIILSFSGLCNRILHALYLFFQKWTDTLHPLFQ